MTTHPGLTKLFCRSERRGFLVTYQYHWEQFCYQVNFLCLFVISKCLWCFACWAALVLWIVDFAPRGLEIWAPVTLVRYEPRHRLTAQRSSSHISWPPRVGPSPPLSGVASSPVICSYHPPPKKTMIFVSFLNQTVFWFISIALFQGGYLLWFDLLSNVLRKVVIDRLDGAAYWPNRDSLTLPPVVLFF